MSRQIALRLPEDRLAALDRSVAAGRYPSRAAAVRAGVELLLGEERERQIEESYRRGYGKYPQEEWIGEVGAWAMNEILKNDPWPPEQDAAENKAQ